MQPVTQDITVYQGDYFEFFFRVRDRVWNAALNGGLGGWEPGSYRDLTGKRARAEIRATAGGATALATFSYTLFDQTDPLTKGGVLLYLLPAATLALVANGVWDVQVESNITTPLDVQTYIAGAVTLVKQVTV